MIVTRLSIDGVGVGVGVGSGVCEGARLGRSVGA
jgi:hypothetical protein